MGGSTASDGGSGVLGGSGGVTGIAGADGGTGGAGEEPNKIILFDGSEESFKDWVSVRNHGQNPWEDNGDGTMTVRVNTGDIQSKQKFQNVFVHLEYVIPHIIPQGASPHERGDSGVLLNGSYELQILDVTSSYDLNPTLGCGAVYNVRAPLEVACHEQEVWNTYEIEFQAPICDPEDPSIVVTPARFVEVKLNGTLIHRNVDVLAPTQGGQPERCEPQGLLLQDRGTIVPVFFRNIWAIPRN